MDARVAHHRRQMLNEELVDVGVRTGALEVGYGLEHLAPSGAAEDVGPWAPMPSASALTYSRIIRRSNTVS